MANLGKAGERTARGMLLAAAMLIAAVAAAPLALAADRVALVIGNNAYEYAPKLNNAVGDARGVAAVLKSAGFDVIEAYDQTAREIEDLLDGYANELAGARIGLVYFAGHGIQYEGTSYLVPVDVDLEDERDLRKTISADYFLQDSSEASELGIVILDACRDSPFVKKMAESIGATRSVSLGRGLSRVGSVPKKTLLGFATQAGNVALDGAADAGGHSPYAAALMKHLATPGKDVRLVFGAVRDEVLSLTDGKQEPYTYGSLGADEVHLVPAATGPEGDAIAALDLPEIASLGAIPADYLAWKTSVRDGDWRPLEGVAEGSDYFGLVYRLFDEERGTGLNPEEALKRAGGRTVAVDRLPGGDAEALQRALRDLNFYGGDVDGRPGPMTRRAVEQFAFLETGEAKATVRALVRLGELAATRQPTSAYTGTWRGRYEYPDDRPGVDFTMSLIFAQGQISGSIIEPNTFGDKTSANLYANFTGTVNADDVRWIKKYDGTAGVDHSIVYEGKLDRAAKRIEGRWSIRADWSGTFAIALTGQP